MEFIKKGLVNTKYLSDGCEFKKSNDVYRLLSTENEKFQPFLNESHYLGFWDMLSKADISHGDKHNKVHLMLLDHFKCGNTIFNDNTDLLLKKGEKIIFSMNGIELNEPKSIRVTNSSHYGSGHKRGNHSIGFGVSTSVGESQEVIKNVDRGQMIITNKRFIFSGAKRNVDVNISQIISVTTYSNGIKLQRKGKKKSEYFIGIDKLYFNYNYENEKYFFVANGNFIKAMVEGGLNKTPVKSKLMIAKSQSKELPQKETSSKTKVSVDTDNTIIKLEFPDDWKKQENNGKGNILTIDKASGKSKSQIKMLCQKIPEDMKEFEEKIAQITSESFRDVDIEHKIINNIKMFTGHSTNENNIELIFSYFDDGYLQYRVTLSHIHGSSAKDDYFDILNSIKFVEKTDKEDNSAKYCSNCGKNLEEGSKFCPECRSKI